MSPIAASRLAVVFTSLVAACAFEEGCGTSKAPFHPTVTLHPLAEPEAADGIVFQNADQLPSPLDKAVCPYPPSMLEMGVSGEVTLSFVVAQDGSVRDVRVINSTDISFAEAARQGVLRQRFSPATAGGQPIDCRVHCAIKFTATPGSQIRAEQTN
jgi:TonB family protein